MGFTKKQRVFIEEYLQCWNATEAARRAGYSERTANRIASNLLSKVDIQEEIQRRIEEKSMSADEVLTRLAEQARGLSDEYRDKFGRIDINKLLDAGLGHLIKEDYNNQYGRVIKFYDSQKALELLGKHHKLFAEKLDIHHEGSIVLVNWDDNNHDTD